MKKWNTPVVDELNVACTEQGKKISSNFDEIRVDQNGNYWASFTSGESNITEPEKEVIVK